MPRLWDVGHCIYCGSSADLTDEHIVPQSFGGTWVLPKSSCKSCNVVTSKIEQYVARNMYWLPRVKLGIRTNPKRKKEKPKSWPIDIVENDLTIRKYIEINDMPLVYVVIEPIVAGIIESRPLSDRNPEMKVSVKGDISAIERLMVVESANIQIISDSLWFPLFQMLAKIAHAYTVAVAGSGGIAFFLPELILGAKKFVGHYVGGMIDETPDMKSDEQLRLSLRTIRNEKYLCVTINLMPNTLPIYDVISAKLIDHSPVMSRIKLYNEYLENRG